MALKEKDSNCIQVPINFNKKLTKSEKVRFRVALTVGVAVAIANLNQSRRSGRCSWRKVGDLKLPIQNV